MNPLRNPLAVALATLTLLSIQACHKSSPSGPPADNGNALTPYNWGTQTSPRSTPLISVAMSDAMTATAVGSGGTIIRTVDGGISWTSVQSGTDDDLYGVSFIDRYTGLVAGGRTMLRTTDGGETWNRVGVASYGVLRNVQMVSAAVGYAVTNWDLGGGTFQGEIFRTDDGGMSWSEQRLPEGTSGLYGIHFLNPSVGTVTSRTGQILHTIDGGQTWTMQQSGTTTFLHSVFFNTPLTGTAVGGVQGGTVGTILRTTDGGATWTPRSASGLNVFLYRVWFANEKRGMAVGYNGRVLRTNDGGATWVDQSVATTNRIMGLSFLNDSIGIVVGDNGMILRAKY